MKTRLADLDTLAAFAKRFIDERPQGAIVGLTGDLGAGKTTFVRAVISALCAKTGDAVPRVVSPSYVIHQSYRKLARPVEHYDLYRMDRVTFESLVDMGYFEAWDEARARHGFVFVEWPERAGDSLLRLDTKLHLEIVGDAREAIISVPQP